MTVSQDGRGNFSTITDAINVAANNSDGRNGYLMIYVNASVYEEYISIAQDKKYLVMKGTGINKIVITGCRTVADGWSTFNSATFVGLITLHFTNAACEGYQDSLYIFSMRQFY
ncbi:hypothetical protein Ddye_014266 [Dipteronia dyeriana]|uniref:Pectinesterase catalytic domain-containing protein n=1 Tax=Dipteronia dyeriana TaxID=168575 RepID=A0AAD9X7W9_9ROSI|nr:hypothetical protein Ddye_014266 [Dipteronia dyeriana]